MSPRLPGTNPYLTCLSLLLCLLYSGNGSAETIPPCYQQIARHYRIPAAVLYGVALTESGLKLKSGRIRPWPWTLNVRGIPKRYATRKAAYRGLLTFFKRGIRSIDIGLMQVNWRYHRRKLRSPWQALDPLYNVKTAANILIEQYRKTGHWAKAIGRYHSPGQKPAQKKRAVRYAQRVMERISRLKKTG
jgi:Transglycosylase SLT domain